MISLHFKEFHRCSCFFLDSKGFQWISGDLKDFIGFQGISINLSIFEWNGLKDILNDFKEFQEMPRDSFDGSSEILKDSLVFERI